MEQLAPIEEKKVPTNVLSKLISKPFTEEIYIISAR